MWADGIAGSLIVVVKKSKEAAYPYLRFSENQYWFRTISENFYDLWLIQKDFRIKCKVISEFLWISEKVREKILHSFESDDNSE